MPDLTALTPDELARLMPVLQSLRVDTVPKAPWRWRVLYALKCWCDRRLYGAVQVPNKCCPACGLATEPGQRVQPPYHAACAPHR